MPGRTGYPERIKLQMGKAVAFILQCFLSTRSNPIPDFNMTESDLRRYYRVSLHVNIDEKFQKNLRNWLLGERFPDEKKLHLMISEIAKDASGDRIFNIEDYDVGKWKAFISEYRRYLITNQDNAILDEPQVFFERIKSSSPAKVTANSLELYIFKTQEYVNRHRSKANSMDHGQVFDTFLDELMGIRSRIEYQTQETDRTDFRQELEEIRVLCFNTELKLLNMSLASGTGARVFFSDDGFAMNDCTQAVWCDNPARRKIAIGLGLIKRDHNPKLSMKRILLLKSLHIEDYNEGELLLLSRDIQFLVNNRIDVAIGSQSIANSVDQDMYNYAIIDDGTIMRAGSNHADWRIAKVGEGDKEFKTLYKNYLNMDEHCRTLGIEFNAEEYREYLGRTEECLNVVHRDLQIRLDGIPFSNRGTRRRNPSQQSPA